MTKKSWDGTLRLTLSEESKYWHDQSGFWTLKLTKKSWDGTLRLTLSEGSKYWHDQSGFWTLKLNKKSWDGTLRLTVSEEWTDRINWLFVCGYKFWKAKIWLNDIWMGMVKNGHDLLVCETLKSAAS